MNNLKYIDTSTNTESTLTGDGRTLLLDKLATTEKIEFGRIAKLIGALPGYPAPEQIRFNLQKGQRQHLKGHLTDVRLARSLKRWHALSEATKTAIVDLLVDPARDEEANRKALTAQFDLSNDEASSLIATDLPDGYLELSRKALAHGRHGTGLIAAMERGLLYQAGAGLDDAGQPTDALHAAGYLRSDELQRRIFDVLPDPERIHDAPIGDIPNPVVRRTLVELRKLVNALLREQRRQRGEPHWKPDAIHIEMAREIKQGERARKEHGKKMRDREALRDAAAKKIRAHGVRVTRDAIIRHLLWEEQDYVCPYSGKSISLTQLFNGDTDLDHILPYSRCLDDSQMNKVVCFRRENDLKGQQSPYEWLADREPGQYEQVCQRAKKLPYPKYRRFLQKEVKTDDFIARQLVDTSYIARATAEYLRCLFSSEDRNRGAVLGLKGQLTAELRRQWGLNDLLNPEALDIKSREDHRHHAVDAIVIAMTDRPRLQKLTTIRKAGGVLRTGEALEYPWDSFREDVQRCVNAIHVSHRPARKVAGALHEETHYGQHRNDAGKVVEGEFVVRKPIDALSANEIPNIRDIAVRDAIIRRLADAGFDIGRGKKIAPADMKRILGNTDNPVHLIGKKSGTLGPPIKKVRVVRKEQTIRPLRGGEHTTFVKPGSTHHLSFFRYGEKGKTKYEAIWTTMLEAADRVKQQTQRLADARRTIEAATGRRVSTKDPRLGREMKKIAADLPLITQKHPSRSNAEFLFSLSRGEMVLGQVDGREELLVYNTSASTQGQIYFHHHADARPLSNKRKIAFTSNTLLDRSQARKVTVDYLGQIRWAND